MQITDIIARMGGPLGQLGGGNLLDNVLSPEPTDVGMGDGVLGDLLGGLLGGKSADGAGSLASMPDMNGDGNPLDDILGAAGKPLR